MKKIAPGFLLPSAAYCIMRKQAHRYQGQVRGTPGSGDTIGGSGDTILNYCLAV